MRVRLHLNAEARNFHQIEIHIVRTAASGQITVTAHGPADINKPLRFL